MKTVYKLISGSCEVRNISELYEGIALGDDYFTEKVFETKEEALAELKKHRTMIRKDRYVITTYFIEEYGVIADTVDEDDASVEFELIKTTPIDEELAALKESES